MARIGDIERIDPNKLIAYENNSKKHPAKQIELLKDSIREFGFLSPILIDKDNNIIAGHGRTLAAVEMGLKSVPCARVEGLTNDQRKAYIIADNRLGKGVENYSESQLKKALVGTEFREGKFLSTSYNDFKNAGSSANTFKSRQVKITYKTKASAQGMMPGNGPGGALGEMIIAPNQKQVIKDVKITNVSARKKGTQSYSLRQVHVTIEVGD